MLIMSEMQPLSVEFIKQARFNMIEQQIRPWDVSDNQVLRLLARIPREQFVPANRAALAFTDTELPLGQGQTMLSPKLEARLLQAAQVKASDRVLEIGTGSGYMAALLGFIAAEVVTVETISDFVTQAAHQLHQALLDNVQVKQGCGFAQGVALANQRGWDLIMLSGSVPSIASIPMALLNTLTTGGRLIAVVGDARHSPMMQAVCMIRRPDGAYSTDYLFDCNAPLLTGVLELPANLIL